MIDNKKGSICLLAGILCLNMLTGCASKTSNNNQEIPKNDQEINDNNKQDEFVSPFTGTSLGEFGTQDIYGNKYDQDIFKDYDLTLVNVFTTWCTPCVEEIPELEKLYQEMKSRKVNVVGILLDVLDEKGNIQDDMLERAKLLVEKSGATYPFLLPDSSYLSGRLIGIESFPETFFVDKNGNIVGETYNGSGGYEDWLAVVEEELKNAKGA